MLSMIVECVKKLVTIFSNFALFLGPFSYLVLMVLATVGVVLLLVILRKYASTAQAQNPRPYDKLEEYLELDLPTLPNPPTALVTLCDAHKARGAELTADSSQVVSPLLYVISKQGEDIKPTITCAAGKFEVLRGITNRLWSFLPNTYELWGRIGREKGYALIQSKEHESLLYEYAWYDLLKETGLCVKPVSLSAPTPSEGYMYRTMIVHEPNTAVADMYEEAWGGKSPDWAGHCIENATKSIYVLSELHKLGIVHGSVSSLAFSGGETYLLHNFSKAAPVSDVGIRTDLNDILTMFIRRVWRVQTERPTINTVIHWWITNNPMQLPFLLWGEDLPFEEEEAQMKLSKIVILRKKLLNKTAPVFRDIMASANAGDAHAMIMGFEKLNVVRRDWSGSELE